ncbi:hypothetical protein ABEB36_005165 [Hypothenemus hampei]|uniref:DUF4592 domain-containing protein n=1 Tax=Hypothenemus hampei TaxID=57062 RepID=A0ABD1EXN2_HYPHA
MAWFLNALTELSSRLRLRRGRGDTSEDDEGLPRSPPCGSPAAANDSFLNLEKTVNKDLPTKSHSTCSDGSLLSMDSSEIDEDSVGLQSRHSSKVSLNDKKIEPESDLELGPSFSYTPLNHSAAHHKVSVRPKRTYGAPRRKKGQLSSALPATPEVNEDASTRSISPESVITEPITELYSNSTNRSLQKLALVSPEVKFKCNSLPAGATPPSSNSFRLSRSKSNAGKSQDDASFQDEDKEEKLSLFERLFPRRSGKKKKKEPSFKPDSLDGSERTNIEERKSVQTQYSTTVSSVKVYTEAKLTTSSSSTFTSNIHSKPIVAPRTGAAARQRIQPIDIPVSPKEKRAFSPITPDKSFSPGTSPIQIELENLLKQRQKATSVGSKEVLLITPPQSPMMPTPIITSTSTTKQLSSSLISSETTTESQVSNEDIRNKIKLVGLSSLQQRVISLNSTQDEDNSYKSLTDVPLKITKPISKSHSFKGEKPIKEKDVEEIFENVSEKRKSVTKAASLDSVKNLEEPIKNHEMKFNLKSIQTANNEKEIEEIEIVPIKSEPEIVSYKQKQTSVEIPRVTTPKIKTPTENEEPPVLVAKSFSANSITISGPSHTAIVNVTSKSDEFNKSSEIEVIDDGVKKFSGKENQVSVTKINMKHETKTSSTALTKSSVPEFLNKQLNKVEMRPTSNIVFSMKSPRVISEEAPSATRPKTIFNFPSGDTNKMPRKFSKEDVEIIEKADGKEVKDSSPPKTPPCVPTTPTTPTQTRYKKNDSRPSSRKSSVISFSSPDSPPIKDPVKERALKTRSVSLDSLKSEGMLETKSTEKSSQESLDKRTTSSVVMRRKSFAKQKNDEEPELMKVFARRSLKLKDEEADQIQEAIIDEQKQPKDSDKENKVEVVIESEKDTSMEERINNIKDNITIKDEKKINKPLIEMKKSPELTKKVIKDEPEVQLRRSLNNNIFLANQRAASLNAPKSLITDFHIKKQSSLNERRKTTNQWLSSKPDDTIEEKQTTTLEIITDSIENNEDAGIETKKNFSQRMAEWEKRAQQAQK